MIKKYLFFIATIVVFFVNIVISNAQISETTKLLKKANYLQGYNKIRNKEVQDIYNSLLAKEPTNAIIYAESGFFNLTYSDKDLGLVDLSVAMYLLENKICDCDYTKAFNDTKEEYHCSLVLLDKIYETKRSFFYEKKAYDSCAYYINKLIHIYTDSASNKIDYSKFKYKKRGTEKLTSLYADKLSISGYLLDYREALKSYRKMVAIDSTKKDYARLIDIYAAMGEYDSVIQIFKSEVFIKTDSGVQFILNYQSLAPQFFYSYLSAYLAKRDFNAAYKLLSENTTVKSVPNAKGKKQKVLLKNFPMYQEGESENICDRMNEQEFEYSFFNFYTCLLNDLTNKNYEIALTHLNSFYKIIAPNFPKLSETDIPNFHYEWYRLNYPIFSLKGYILAKLNKKAEAKEAYQQAIKLNPVCKEALMELKDLQ